MGRRRHQPRHDADADIDDERTPNRHSTDEVVQSVGGQDQVAERAVLIDRAMAVVPVQELLEHMKRNHSGRDPCVDRQMIADQRDRFRQHVKQRLAEQRPRRQRDQGHHRSGEQPFRQQQSLAANQRQRTHGQTRYHDPAQYRRGQKRYRPKCSLVRDQCLLPQVRRTPNVSGIRGGSSTMTCCSYPSGRSVECHLNTRTPGSW